MRTFLRRLGRTDEASGAYREAILLAPNGAGQRFLTRRMGEPVEAPPDSGGRRTLTFPVAEIQTIVTHVS